jgi:preprotein translocase subunit SecF
MVNIVILSVIFETSLKKIKDKIIVNILLIFVYGISTEIFSSLYIDCDILLLIISRDDIIKINNKSKLLYVEKSELNIK